MPNTYYTTNPLLQKPYVGLERTTPTLSGVNGPGAQQMAGGAQRSAMPPAGSATTPAATIPTATPAPAPTIGETLAGIKAQAQTVQQGIDALRESEKKGSLTNPTYDSYPTYAELYPEINQEEIDRRQRKLFQAEIDATNRVYDDMLAQERLAGMGRLGTGRAIASRGGLLGSDFGEAQRQTIVGSNLQAENAVQNERMAKIGVITRTMRQAVADEMTEKRLARQQGAENYINYLASARERKEKNRNLAARAILDAGMDITELDQTELDALGKDAGLSAQEIIMAYNDMKTEREAAANKLDLETRKTESEISKNKRQVLSEGQTLLDEDGNVVYRAPKTYAPGTGGGGSSVSLTPDDKRVLLGGGYSESDISTLEEGVRSQGLQSIITQEKAAGATPSQIKALEKAYGATADSEQFLNKEYFRSLFGEDKLKEDAKEAGAVTGGNDWIPFNESGDTETYLSSLEQTVNLYRQAGYTDQEILKMMQ